MEGTCEHCGASFEMSRHGNAQNRFCSRRCRDTARRARNPRLPKTGECEHCGASFVQSPRGGVRRFCSRRCGDAARRARNRQPPETRECEVCGTTYVAAGKGSTRRRTCSKSCAMKAKNIRSKASARKRGKKIQSGAPKYWDGDTSKIVAQYGKTFTRECKHCGVSFEGHPRAGYCSATPCQEEKFNKYKTQRSDAAKRPHRAATRKRYRESERAKALRRKSAAKPMNRIARRCSTMIRYTLANPKCKPTFEHFDFTKEELFAHIESLFTDGMSWDNMSEWHIDHIRPLASFNFTSEDCEDFKECWALSNLQPLWASDNIRKGAKWNGKDYRKYNSVYKATMD